MRKLTTAEQEALGRLEGILLTEVPPQRFSCWGTEQEGRMCIEPGDGFWLVFFREMGLGEDVTVHPTFEEAALQLIRNVSPSDAAHARMQALFLGGTA